MVRLFIAINLPDDLREKLVAVQQDIPREISMKLVEPENLHLTLKFLGEILPAKVETIKKVISEAILKQTPFELEVKGLGVFPSIQKARVIWAGVSNGWQEVIDLQKSIDKLLIPLGFNPERDFHPHITLARIKFVKDARLLKEFIERMKSKTFGSFRITQIDLMQSTLTSRGPIYTELFSAKFPSTEKDKPT